ncbi:hypothetical protein jhhlp_000377 [Lomentospora prolificans]|uniref:Uncharacterized protein n=1 Tax=Lomentospora prolificans TaxID=41688 RepID=A0A2N3NKN7_9PEZI|nr:hypothetical protein jhhlp_000377 [Lomentospora prolificans]
MWPFTSAAPPSPQPAVATDIIVPLSEEDDTQINRDLLLNLMLRFDAVLDPRKLRESLDKLLARPDWKKLGARLRKNSAGKLEYHIPDHFDENRPAYTYTQLRFDIRIRDHPVASKIPNGFSGDAPANLLNPNEFKELMRRKEGSPSHIDDYLTQDRPQLGLHVTSFTDATLVCISWPHTFWDAMGRREFLLAWTATLAGQEDKVLPLNGFDASPLTGFCDNPKEEYKLLPKRLSIPQMIVFGLRLWFESFWWTQEETRVVCIPASYIQQTKAQAVVELKEAAAAAGQPTEGIFLSDGDILSAWGTKLLTKHIPIGQKQTICILNAFGWRELLAPDILPRSKAYLANASSAVFTYLRGNDVASHPISYSAGLVRQSLQELGTRAQLEASVKLNREAMRATGHPPLYGDATMQLIVVSNWSKAKFFEMDFSPAIVPGTPSAKGGEPVGKPSYIQVCGISNGFSLRNAFQVSGKDRDGNYWLSVTLRKQVWDSINEAWESKTAE